MSTTMRAFVVSHTHWDREWYRSYQSFRVRLVSLMDELITEMEKDPEYRVFHLDGQTIVLEDYLEVRPEMRPALEALIREGRIIIGPWYVMPDEFLVSGESLVRNLQLGRAICRQFGTEPMPSGYVVDIFGHNSQFPQVLRGFGIDSAVLYRGIGDYPKDLFTWVGRDGSRTLVAKLDNERSYSNFYFALRWPFDDRERTEAELLDRARSLLRFAGERATGPAILMMDGCDHIEMDPELPRLLATLNAGLPGTELVHAKLVDYFSARRAEKLELEEIQGELYHVGRRGINNQVLKNVLSSMVHLKQMNDACELALTRWAEPFAAAAFGSGRADVSGFLAVAWRELLRNHPHDSICGCSITRVHEDNIYRFNQVADVASSVTDASLEEIAGAIDPEATDGRRLLLLVNAGQQSHEGITQAVLRLPRQTLGNIRLTGPRGEPVPFQLLSVDPEATVGVYRNKRLPEFRQVAALTVAFPASVPAVGYAAYRYEEVVQSSPPTEPGGLHSPVPPERTVGSMRSSERTWESEYYILEPGAGGVSLTEKRSGRRFDELFFYEDGGDAGDGWNYRKPAADRLCLGGAPVEAAVEADGPFAVVLRLTHELRIPESGTALGRSDATKVVPVRTRITMYRDSPLLTFETVLENTCTDHRLRLVFPTHLAASSFRTATPFAAEERQVLREDTHDAVEIDTGVYPSQGITLVADEKASFGVYARGLYEVEVTEDPSRSVALTLFRSFSREVGRARGEMSLMLRPLRFEYAVELRAGRDSLPEMFVRGNDWRAGVRSLCRDPGRSGARPRQAVASFLSLRGRGIVLSSLRADRGGRLLLRVYNSELHAVEGSARLQGSIAQATRVALDEETVLPEAGDRVAEDTLSFRLAAAEIATFAVTLQ